MNTTMNANSRINKMIDLIEAHPEHDLHGVWLGFHGTHKDNLDSIIASGFKIPQMMDPQSRDEVASL